MKIKIDIEGCTGEGKSTIAQLIKSTLESYGLKCSYEDIDGEELSPIGIERNLTEMAQHEDKYNVEIETVQLKRESLHEPKGLSINIPKITTVVEEKQSWERIEKCVNDGCDYTFTQWELAMLSHCPGCGHTGRHGLSVYTISVIRRRVNTSPKWMFWDKSGYYEYKENDST